MFAAVDPQVWVEPLSGENEGISVLSLNRPEARNALGRQLMRELGECVNTLRQVCAPCGVHV